MFCPIHTCCLDKMITSTGTKCAAVKHRNGVCCWGRNSWLSTGSAVFAPWAQQSGRRGRKLSFTQCRSSTENYCGTFLPTPPRAYNRCTQHIWITGDGHVAHCAQVHTHRKTSRSAFSIYFPVNIDARVLWVLSFIFFPVYLFIYWFSLLCIFFRLCLVGNTLHWFSICL